MEAGAAVSGNIVISIYPGMKNIEESEGYGTVMGIAGGVGPFGSIDLLFAGEGDDTHLVGFAISVGVGEGFNGHIDMIYTVPIYKFSEQNREECID